MRVSSARGARATAVRRGCALTQQAAGVTRWFHMKDTDPAYERYFRHLRSHISDLRSARTRLNAQAARRPLRTNIYFLPQLQRRSRDMETAALFAFSCVAQATNMLFNPSGATDFYADGDCA